MLRQCVPISEAGFAFLLSDMTGGLPLTGSAPDPESLCVVAVVGLVFYDHICTVSREIRVIWRRKFSSVTLLFHVNRWANFIWAAMQLATGFLDTGLIACVSLNYILAASVIVLGVLRAAFATIRVYAISRGSWVPALVVGLLSLLAPCVDIYYLYMVTFAQIIPETSDRIPAGGSSIGLQYGLPIAARVFLLIAEFTVMCTTWYYTRSIKLNNRRGRTGIPLATALQRDGTAAFIILFVLNILQVFTIFTSVIAYPVFSSPLSSIVISHFLLDLREADGASLDTTTFQGSVWSARAQNQSVSLQFNRPHSSFVGDMGASLDYGYDSSDMMANWSDETEDVDDAEVGTLLIGLDEHQPWAQSSRNMAENTSADAVLVDG